MVGEHQRSATSYKRCSQCGIPQEGETCDECGGELMEPL